MIRSTILVSALAIACAAGGCKDKKDEGAPKEPAAKTAEPATPAATPAGEPTVAVTPKADTDTAIGADGSRLDPDGDKNPEAVSLRMLRKIGDGEWPLNRFVDPKRGVIAIEFDTGGGADDAKENKSASLLCGAELEKRLASLPEHIKSSFADDPDMISCQNKPDLGCTISGLGEYSLDTDFHFIKDGEKGVFLTAIVAFERAGLNDEWVEKGDKFVAKKVAELAAKGCK